MNRNPKLHICFDRIIPAELETSHEILRQMQNEALLAATGAKTVREAFHQLDPRAVIPPNHMAVISSKKWPTGSKLKCRFLEGSAKQHARVIHKAKIWEQYANIHLDFVTTHDEQIRIAFQPDQGSYSAVGRDCLDHKCFPKGEPTMNFGWLEDDTDDREYERVVVHEFGHALGCVHEHQQPNEKLEWNVKAVYAEFSGPPNYWDKATIDSNILEKYGPRGVNATIFDRHSIMLYQFPAELFTNHVRTPLNYHLSAKDKAFIAQMYPKAHAARGYRAFQAEVLE